MFLNIGYELGSQAFRELWMKSLFSLPTNMYQRLLRLSRAHFRHPHLWQALVYSILLIQVSVCLMEAFVTLTGDVHIASKVPSAKKSFYNWSLPQTYPSTMQMGTATNCPKIRWCWQITFRNITLPIFSLFNLITLHISSSSSSLLSST